MFFPTYNAKENHLFLLIEAKISNLFYFNLVHGSPLILHEYLFSEAFHIAYNNDLLVI